jgi:hypothetical protein
MKFNNETLRAAVKEWLSDSVASEAKYGHISNWDTSQVTFDPYKELFNMAKSVLNRLDLSREEKKNMWKIVESVFEEISLMYRCPRESAYFHPAFKKYTIKEINEMTFVELIRKWDDQFPLDIYISGVGHEFFYKNIDGDKCSFKAYQLSANTDNNFIPLLEIGDLISDEVGWEIILTFKGKALEPHIITNHPEIIDIGPECYNMRHFKDEISSIKEAVQFINSLKTVKFDSLPKADTDDFISSEYKDWCIDNFNRTK